jgi:DNA-binding transcriptional ArsR family regulator
MNMDPDIARLASMVTEPARASILLTCWTVAAGTATELAKVAGVRASTASAHLKKLLENDLIKASPGGRHRYFRLAGAEIASLIGAAGAFLTVAASRHSGSGAHRRPCALVAFAMDHLAGRLGVEVTEAMVRKSWLIEKGTMVCD